MTINEANKIFRDWKEYAEINDKLMKFFMFSGIPESFLPYPKEMLEEALNIVAKNYFDSGDHKASEAVKNTIAFLIFYKSDEEAFDTITNNLMIKDTKIREAILNNLKEARDSWTKFKDKH